MTVLVEDCCVDKNVTQPRALDWINAVHFLGPKEACHLPHLPLMKTTGCLCLCSTVPSRVDSPMQTAFQSDRPTSPGLRCILRIQQDRLEGCRLKCDTRLATKRKPASLTTKLGTEPLHSCNNDTNYIFNQDALVGDRIREVQALQSSTPVNMSLVLAEDQDALREI